MWVIWGLGGLVGEIAKVGNLRMRWKTSTSSLQIVQRSRKKQETNSNKRKKSSIGLSEGMGSEIHSLFQFHLCHG